MTNTIDKLLQASEKLNVIVAPNSSAESSVSSLKTKHSIDTPEELKKVLDNIVNQNRLMNIGIVGRVKAGKSSLLNALFFKGKNILPSAATPMTAALTTLTYGDNFSATVVFYSTQDIENIRIKAEEYKRRVAEKVIEITERKNRKIKVAPGTTKAIGIEMEKPTNDYVDSYQENKYNSSRLDKENSDQVKQIQSRAEKEIKKDAVLSAAIDQYQRMQQSGLLGKINDKKTIEAANEDDLSTCLIEFVGADGQYMPFTKSVEITLPLDSLKDICVIDTPGFNDPVQSREARTVELLKSCDAIFIVSPSGQFLSAQDLEMMGRITKKEGVQEIMVVASQVDMQLFGSEKRIGIDDTLDNIVGQLATAMQSTMRRFKENNPEVGSTFDHLIQDSGNNLYYSSGISHAIAQRQENEQPLNDSEEHVWSSLLAHYPDYLSNSDKELSISTLNSIANIEILKQAIEEVRSKKEDVLQQRIENFVSAKLNALIEFKREVINETEQSINTIKLSDIETEKQKIKEFGKQEEKIEQGIKYVYSEAVDRLVIDTKNKLQDTVSKEYDKVFKRITDSVGTATESRSRERSGGVPWLARKLGVGGYESYQVEVKQVYSAQVIKSLDDFLSNIKITCSRIVDENKIIFKKDIFNDVVGQLRDTLGDDATDPNTTRNVLRKVLDSMPNYEFMSTVKIPNSLQGKGTVKGNQADEFENQVYEFARAQRATYDIDIELLVEDMNEVLSTDISPQFTKELKAESNRFRDILANKEMSIERLERFKSSLAKVTI